MNSIFKRRVKIRGTGSVMPGKAVSSAEIDGQLGLAKGTVQRMSGVESRNFAGSDETAASLAAAACRKALAAAELELGQIDALFSANATMDCGLPYNAALLHRELGVSGGVLPAFDVGMSCLSFLAALEQVSWAMAAGRYRNVLIASADLASCGLNWDNADSSYIFGDGAAAAVLSVAEADDQCGIVASRFETFSHGADFCQIPAGGSRFHPSRTPEFNAQMTMFQMDGPRLFRLVAKHLPSFYRELLEDAGCEAGQIDCVVPHQGSKQAIEHCSRLIGLNEKTVINIFAAHGNQVGASLPTALDCAITSGRLKRGQRALLMGFGAGVSMGGMILDY